jgi:RNA polymerase sigma factor (sigma-70 family)
MTGDKCDAATGTALNTLLANHRRFLDFLSARVASREVAEEILQEAFVRGVEKASEIRDVESVVAWFYRLLRNAVVDHYRHNAAGRKALEAHSRDAKVEEAAYDSDLEQAICECVNDLIPLLRPEYADIVRRVDLGGSDVSATADELGITPGNARVRLHRARAALRAELERSCRTCAYHGCLDCSCSRDTK